MEHEAWKRAWKKGMEKCIYDANIANARKMKSLKGFIRCGGSPTICGC